MKLGHANPAEQAAVAAVVKRDVTQLIDRFMSSGFAAMFRQQAHQKLDSAEGRQFLLAIVDHALDEYDRVHASTTPAA